MPKIQRTLWTNFRLVCVSLILSALTIACDVDSQLDTGLEGGTPGINLRLSLDRTSIEQEPPILCNVFLVNNGESTQVVHDIFVLGSKYFQILVEDEDGHEVAYAGPILELSLPAAPVRLLPGSYLGRRFYCLHNIQTNGFLFDFSTAGSYQVRAMFVQQKSMFEPAWRSITIPEILWEGELLSNGVAVQFHETVEE